MINPPFLCDFIQGLSLLGILFHVSSRDILILQQKVWHLFHSNTLSSWFPWHLVRTSTKSQLTDMSHHPIQWWPMHTRDHGLPNGGSQIFVGLWEKLVSTQMPKDQMKERWRWGIYWLLSASSCFWLKTHRTNSIGNFCAFYQQLGHANNENMIHVENLKRKSPLTSLSGESHCSYLNVSLKCFVHRLYINIHRQAL
jgi:hypothetical protein